MTTTWPKALLIAAGLVALGLFLFLRRHPSAPFAFLKASEALATPKIEKLRAQIAEVLAKERFEDRVKLAKARQELEAVRKSLEAKYEERGLSSADVADRLRRLHI